MLSNSDTGMPADSYVTQGSGSWIFSSVANIVDFSYSFLRRCKNRTRRTIAAIETTPRVAPILTPAVAPYERLEEGSDDGVLDAG